MFHRPCFFLSPRLFPHNTCLPNRGCAGSGMCSYLYTWCSPSGENSRPVHMQHSFNMNRPPQNIVQSRRGAQRRCAVAFRNRANHPQLPYKAVDQHYTKACHNGRTSPHYSQGQRVLSISGNFTRRSSGQKRVLKLDESLPLAIFDEGLCRLQIRIDFAALAFIGPCT